MSSGRLGDEASMLRHIETMTGRVLPPFPVVQRQPQRVVVWRETASRIWNEAPIGKTARKRKAAL